MEQPTVWIVGDWQHADFFEPIAWLKTSARCICYDGASAVAASRIAGAPSVSPDAILFVQSRPGQISRFDVEQLHAAAPLARLLALVGPWCDGEMRSGQPWPGVMRIPWHFWKCRLENELGLPESNPNPTRFPRTATAAERLEATLAALPRQNASPSTAAIFTSRRASYESMADLLRQLRIVPCWQCETETSTVDPELLIFDGWDHVPANDDGPSAAAHPSSPQLLLLHFPRSADHARAASRGISAVLAYPLLLTDLAVTLDHLCTSAFGPKSGPALTPAACRN